MTDRERAFAVTILKTFITLSAAVVFRDSPEDMVLTAGNTAVLRCSVQPQGSEREPVKWLHLESNRVLSKDETITASTQEEKYSVVGNHERSGEYHLKIIGVQPSDEGEYRCMYGSEYRSAVVKVVIPLDTGYPLCDVQPDPTQQLPGGISELSCTSHRGSPPDDLIWYREGVPISDETQQKNAMQTAVAAGDNGVKFTCFARSSAASMKPRSCTVMLLNIPPSGYISPDTHIVHPGDVATYTCSGEGIPVVTGYTWLVNYIHVTSKENRGNRYELLNNNTTLQISDVRRWENGAVIACEVSIASGLKGRAWAKLSIASSPVTSAASGANPGLLFPSIEETAIENNKKNIGPTVLKPQTKTATAGVVAGAVMATIGVILALVAIAILLIRTKISGHFSMDAANKKKCLRETPSLSRGTIKKVDACPIYAKPNKLRKGPAPAPPGAPAIVPVQAPSDLATQKRKSRKNHHSYEKVDILGCSSPGQTRTLPVRLQKQAPTTPDTRRSDTSRFTKAHAPLPPGLPPPLRSPPPPPPQMSPTLTPRSPSTRELVYADLDLSARRETINQSGPFGGVDYAMLQVHNSAGSREYDRGTSGVHNTSDNTNK